MKKRWCGVFAVILALCLTNTMVWASNHATVRFGANNQISYEGSSGATKEGSLIGNAFRGMAPGETRTETITLSNDNLKTVAFYISQKTLKNLEETNQASGGAYIWNLSIGDSQSEAVSVMDALAGGYKTGQASKNGLSDVDGLKAYTYLTTLKQNETKNMYLTLQLEGEGIDSTEQVDYTASIAKIEMNFQVEEVNQTPEKNIVTETITKIKNQVIPLSDTVRTGDTTPILFYGVCFITGVGMIIMFRKKKKGADQV